MFGLKFVARTGFESGWRQSRNSWMSTGMSRLLFDPDIHFLALPMFGLKFVARTGFESGWRQSRNSWMSTGMSRLFVPDFYFVALPMFGLKFVARTGFESGWRQSRNSARRGSVPFSADLFHSHGSWWNICGLSAANRFSTSPNVGSLLSGW